MIFGCSHVNLNTRSSTTAVCRAFVPFLWAVLHGVESGLSSWADGISALLCFIAVAQRRALSPRQAGFAFAHEYASITSLSISALAIPLLVVQAGLKTPRLKWYYQLSLSRSWAFRCTPDALSLSRSPEGSPCLSDSSLMSSLCMGPSWTYPGPVSMMSSYFTFLLVLLLFMYFWVIPIRVHSFQKQDKP